jgi:capsular polysaccharide biosynthesis protein
MFQVLEYAEVPDQKSKPSRGLICIIVTFAAGFISVFIAFAMNAIDNIKKDPEAMAKLRGLPFEKQTTKYSINSIKGKSN